MSPNWYLIVEPWPKFRQPDPTSTRIPDFQSRLQTLPDGFRPWDEANQEGTP